MSRRKRWQNLRGTEGRVHEPRERLLAAAASASAWLLSPFLRPPSKEDPRDILLLRLDRIGDVLMSLPAIHALRNELPDARIRLAVGEWSQEIASEAPVDEVLVWSAPWVGRADEGAARISSLLRDARALARRPPDLAIDLQGDLRAMWLMAATGAASRIGYANTGSAALLTRTIPLTEDVNLVEQNYRAIEVALGRNVPRAMFRWIDETGRARGRDRLRAALLLAGISPTGPIVGIHPGAGRRIKEWPIERFAELGQRLMRHAAATLVLTGASGEAQKTQAIRAGAPGATLDLAGGQSLRELAETMSALDAFVSCDTSAMHFACAIGVPSVAIFGPSDPGRYFSGGALGFGSKAPHVVLRPHLWCSPCNLIRRPPEECLETPIPECLDRITVEDAYQAVVRVLESATPIVR